MKRLSVDKACSFTILYCLLKLLYHVQIANYNPLEIIHDILIAATRCAS